MSPLSLLSFFFFNDTATTEIYTLSLHDALPICRSRREGVHQDRPGPVAGRINRGAVDRRSGAVSFGNDAARRVRGRDRKSTRLNSSHLVISYAVFCLKKKKSVPIHVPSLTLSPS